MAAYYNEHDPFAANWLRNLIREGWLPEGEVDERDIRDVAASDLSGFVQHHFFAGIGGWPYALRLAGWPDDRPVVTGSCPCQPFSTAGKRKGINDERHLWPEMFRLVRELRPSVIFGEQVGSRDGRDWLSGVQRLRDEEIVIRVLQEQQGASSSGLQRVLESARASKKTKDLVFEAFRHVQGISRAQSGQAALQCGEEQGGKDRRSLHADEGRRGLYPRCHRCGRLRNDWNPIQSEGGADVGQSVHRQNQSGGGLYENQCPCGAVVHQCDGEYVGRQQDSRDRGRDYGEAAGGIGDLSSKVGISFEGPLLTGRLNGIRTDLESLGYVVGAADLPAAGVGSPHKRQRLFWVADARHEQTWRTATSGKTTRGRTLSESTGRCPNSMEYANDSGPLTRHAPGESGRHGNPADSTGGERDGLGDAIQPRLEGLSGIRGREGVDARPTTEPQGWSDYDIVWCDERITGRGFVARRVESGTFPLAARVPGRVGLLRGYGNSIVPQVAAEFIMAFILGGTNG